MKQRLALAAVLAGFFAISTTATAAPFALHSESIKLPEPNETFKGPGAGPANDYCRICHSADFVAIQPPLTAASWKVEVVKMQKAFKCPIPDSEVEPLVSYLVKINGKP